ncbi:hypothetical protein BVRB_1g002710 [Beta vulgaris subsp. vulgaris]|nr:hypothetical protein BVRB_1g002710 [Beta vulgaris subsp. vulgaris]
MEEIQIPNNNNINSPTNINNSRATQVIGDQRRARPQKDQNLNCPRCNSTNTKFCYYNNYSLTQPRYFCKTCRRYWTQGGSLRNVPVGGGSRKNKRSSSSSSSSSSNPSSTSIITNPNNPTNKLIPDLNPPISSLSHHLITSSQNPKFLQGQDLNLAFPMQGIFQPNNNENHEPINIMNSNNNTSSTTNNTCSTTTCSTPISALELLRTGIASRGSLNPYVPMPMPDSNTLYPSGFPNLQEYKPNMNLFSSPGDHNNNVGSADNNNNNNAAARLLFPFADMNKLATSTPSLSTTPQHHQHNQHHQHEISDDQSKGGNDHHQPQQQQQHHNHHHHQAPTTGYWSGMLGGGTW